MDIPPESAAITPPVPAGLDDHVRLRLLNAAVHVFNRKGYAGASVREVAELAGVTKPTLYYYFGSKEGVLVAILNEARQQFSAAVAAALRRPGSAWSRIVALCEDVYAMFEHNVPVTRVAHAVFLGPPDVAPPFDFTVFEIAFREAIEQMVTEGQAAGEFRATSPSDIALAVMGIVTSCNERRLHPAFTPISPDRLARLLGLLHDGITRAPRAQGEERQ